MIALPLASHLVLACCALALLSGLVMFRLLLVRSGEMKIRSLGMQDVSTSLQVQSNLQRVQASDNFKNLFEMPVLFYALCGMLVALGRTDLAWAWAAWGYVVLRAAHTLIQCTYNAVLHRFVAFFLSALVVLGMWLALAWTTLP